MSFIEVIPHEHATGRLKEIYDDLLEKRGKLAEVHKIQSLNPESIVSHMDLYMNLMFGKSPLRRYQREMIAVVVSAANKCDYCITHHGAALNHFWKDQGKVGLLAEDYTMLNLNEIDRTLCDYSVNLTLDPGGADDQWVQQLKDLGLDDRMILDATLVVSYFNFVNRIVMGLGVDIEEDGGKGYDYD